VLVSGQVRSSQRIAQPDRVPDRRHASGPPVQESALGLGRDVRVNPVDLEPESIARKCLSDRQTFDPAIGVQNRSLQQTGPEVRQQRRQIVRLGPGTLRGIELTPPGEDIRLSGDREPMRRGLTDYPDEIGKILREGGGRILG